MPRQCFAEKKALDVLDTHILDKLTLEGKRELLGVLSRLPRGGDCLENVEVGRDSLARIKASAGAGGGPHDVIAVVKQTYSEATAKAVEDCTKGDVGAIVALTEEVKQYLDEWEALLRGPINDYEAGWERLVEGLGKSRNPLVQGAYFIKAGGFYLDYRLSQVRVGRDARAILWELGKGNKRGRLSIRQWGSRSRFGRRLEVCGFCRG